MRSKTTSMSRLRSGNALSRWTSMKRGAVTSGAMAVDGRVEPLRVTDGEHGIRPSRDLDHRIGVRQRTRHRFLDQHGDTALQERHGNLMVDLGRHGNDDRVHVVQHVTIVGTARERRSSRPHPPPSRERGPRLPRARRRPSADNSRAWWRPRWPMPMTAVRSGSGGMGPLRPADDGDAGLVGGGEHVLAVEHERAAGIDRQRRRAGDAHRLYRRKPDDRARRTACPASAWRLSRCGRRARPDTRHGR